MLTPRPYTRTPRIRVRARERARVREPELGPAPGLSPVSVTSRGGTPASQVWLSMRSIRRTPAVVGTVPDITASSICTASAPDRAALSIIRQGSHGGRPSSLD